MEDREGLSERGGRDAGVWVEEGFDPGRMIGAVEVEGGEGEATVTPNDSRRIHRDIVYPDVGNRVREGRTRPLVMPSKDM